MRIVSDNKMLKLYLRLALSHRQLPRGELGMDRERGRVGKTGTCRAIAGYITYSSYTYTHTYTHSAYLPRKQKT